MFLCVDFFWMCGVFLENDDIKICRSIFFRLTCLLWIGGVFKCSVGPFKLCTICTFFWRSKPPQQSSSCIAAPEKMITEMNSTRNGYKNRYIVAENSQLIVEKEHGKVSRFLLYAQSCAFWSKIADFGHIDCFPAQTWKIYNCQLFFPKLKRKNVL